MVEHNASDRPSPSDERLMELVAGGDGTALGVLLSRHQARLQAFSRRLLGRSEDAEDCVQEVFVRLWVAREHYQPRTKFTTYLYTIAVNYCTDCARRSSVRPRTVPLEEQLGDGARALLQTIVQRGQQPDALLHRKHQLSRVRTALHQLPIPQRTAFVLAHFEQLPYAEISRVLGVPVGTVKSRVYHAIRRLRAVLDPE